MLRQLKYIIFSIILFPVVVNAQYVSDFRVNDDTGSVYHSFASLDVDGEGNFVVVWMDKRHGEVANIFAQRFDKHGQKIGINFNINIISDSIGNAFPYIAYNKKYFLVTWVQSFWTGPQKIKLRIFSLDGFPISSEFDVNDSIYIITTSIPTIGTSFNSSFVSMSYTPGTSGHRKIFLQKFDSSGNKIGSNQPVADSGISSAQDTPAINKDIYNRFIVSWGDTRFSISDIFMQLYDSTGQKIGINKKVTDDNVPDSPRGKPSVSSDSSGRFILSWTDSRLTFGDKDNIFAQRYDLSGNEIGNNFRVDLGPVNVWNRRSPKVATRRDGNTVIAWNDQIGGPTMRKLSPEGLFTGGEYFISYQGVGNSKILNDIAIWEDRVITVWQDNRNGDYDIYCNIRSYQNPDSIISNITTITNEIPEDFKLYQNYPNPFNSSTKIRFEIPIEFNMEKSNVKLKLYNTLGQEVAFLINETLEPGMYEYFWDAREIPSGVYYYTLQTGNFRHTKRLALVK